MLRFALLGMVSYDGGKQLGYRLAFIESASEVRWSILISYVIS